MAAFPNKTSGLVAANLMSVCVPGVDVVLVPRGAGVELDEGVVALGRVDESGDGLLEGVLEGVVVGVREASAVGREGGLGVVEEAGADGAGRDVVGGELTRMKLVCVCCI